jgi:hypothetical protein
LSGGCILCAWMDARTSPWSETAARDQQAWLLRCLVLLVCFLARSFLHHHQRRVPGTAAGNRVEERVSERNLRPLDIRSDVVNLTETLTRANST